MKLELKEEKTNPYMKRKELCIAIEHDGEATPSTAALRDLAAKQFGHNLDNTEVRNIFTEGGVGRSMAKIFVWTEKKVEPKIKKKKEGA